MGVVENISHSKFPVQSNSVGQLVRVTFNYEFHHPIIGRIVRDDREAPYVCIIHLADDRFVLAEECQYASA